MKFSILVGQMIIGQMIVGKKIVEQMIVGQMTEPLLCKSNQNCTVPLECKC